MSSFILFLSTLLFRENCDIIQKNDKDYFLSPKYVMKEGLDSFISRVRDQFPEIDSKRKLLKYMPFFVKTKAFGWSTQCTCIRHANFANSLDYINQLIPFIKNDKFEKLSYDNFQDYFCCDEAKTDEKNRIQQMYTCFLRWETSHCFDHKKAKSSCHGKITYSVKINYSESKLIKNYNQYFIKIALICACHNLKNH